MAKVLVGRVLIGNQPAALESLHNENIVHLIENFVHLCRPGSVLPWVALPLAGVVPGENNDMSLSRSQQLELYRRMHRIRQFEEAIQRTELGGHLSIGQEAAVAGA